MTVGIRHYRNLQPLQCAERDAQTLHEWLTELGGVSRERALLLTDSSPDFHRHSTHPDRTTLSYWIRQLRSHAIQPGDTLWFFFSGYGDCWNGDDYLLPIDADPAAPSQAWIKTKSLLHALKSLPTDRILVLLDINRSQSVRHAQRLGEQTAHYAKTLEIPTLLSCQPGEFSQESLAIGHGLFTAALLDGLRSHQPQEGLQHLCHRLSLHLPELCHQNHRPVQKPLIILPADRQISPPEPIVPILQLPDRLMNTGDLRITTKNVGIPSRFVLSPPASIPQDHPIPHHPIPQNPKSKIQNPKSKIHLPLERTLLFLTGLLALCSTLLLTLSLRAPLMPRLHAQQITPPTPTPTPSPTPKLYPPDRKSQLPLSVPEPPQGTSEAILEEARSYITPSNPDELLRAIDRASQIPPGDPGYPAAQRQIDRWSEQLLRLAQRQANVGNWSGAIAIATHIRADRTTLYPKVQTLLQSWRQRQS